MRIKSVDFAGAIGQLGQAPPASVVGAPQIAVAGRSNVGKSSLINRLLGRTRSPIARVSQRPGKTQEINFYEVRADPSDFVLVDLPGYGFAKVPAALRDRWKPLIASFLLENAHLRGVVQLIDIRHGPTSDDMDAIGRLADAEIPVLFVLTKADKLKPQKRAQAILDITRSLGVDADQVLPVSALSGAGMPDLLETLGGLLQMGGEPETAEEGEAENEVESEGSDQDDVVAEG